MDTAIVIPVYNEKADFITYLEKLGTSGSFARIVVVDASEGDQFTRTKGQVESVAARLKNTRLVSLRSHVANRAEQMNQGARACTSEALLFLHADTFLPEQAAGLVKDALRTTSSWGRFDVRLDGAHWMLRIIERMMNWRSCLTGIATGDQALFLHREVFEQVDGFPSQALMEDIEISKRLKSISRPVCIKTPVITSARRWEQQGVFKTMITMWVLRLRYWLGANPETLAEHYYQAR